MGTSTSAAEFSGKIAKWASNVAKLPKEVQEQNIKTAEKVMGAAVASMSGGDDKLSRVNKGKGASVGAKAFAEGSGTVHVVPKGPVWLVENPTEAHLIGAGRGRTTTRGGREFVQGLTKSYKLDLGTPLHLTDGEWVTGPIIHKGTTGKHAWAKARDGLDPQIVADVSRAMIATAAKVF